MSLKTVFIISGLLLGFTSQLSAQALPKLDVLIDFHYGNSIITEPQEDDLKGRYGYGIEMHYFFRNNVKGFRTALGIAYSRIGNSREFIWEDVTPEREMLYGKFPIHYTMWSDVHYFSIPVTLQYQSGNKTFLSTEISLDYPFGTSFYNKRSSDDGGVTEINEDRFSATKAYPWNTSIGIGIRFGKSIPLNSDLNLLIGGKFKVYGLVAARSNDYFPHEDYERPYSIGINIGVSI